MSESIHSPAAARPRLVLLISGQGTNMQAIVEAALAERWAVEIAAVIANKADAPGLAWAAARGIPTEAVPHRDYATREAFDAALAQRIDAYEPHYVVLAGFMRVLTSGFVASYAGRLVNIHPSLLPAFPGLHTHAQALAVGVRAHGCTVHFVTPVLDHGPIIAQGVVPVLERDTAETLASRVLSVEHKVYPAAVRWLVEGRVSVADNLVRVAGDPPRLFHFEEPPHA